MGKAYTPTLSVTPSTLISKIRELPLPGKNLVQPGDLVTHKTTVLSTELPGELEVIRLAERLGFDPVDIVPGVKVTRGDSVVKGDILCEIKTFFNLFSTSLESPSSGTIEFYLEENGHLGIRQPSTPLEVTAYIDGRVTEVVQGKSVTIESEASLIQGIFGVGGECHGEILTLSGKDELEITPEDIKGLNVDLTNKILIGGARFTKKALNLVSEYGVSAVVTGSIDSEILADFLGYELGVSVTGDEDLPFSLIVTEGFGHLALSSRVSALARQLDGKMASANGATQVRAGAMRPEIIVSREIEQPPKLSHEEQTSSLEVGARVRVVRVPYFGEFGEIVALPTAPAKIDSGALVRVVKVLLENDNEILVPRANIELI